MAECNYSQFDKESLALVVGVKRFHDYLYGKTFEIMTDHKPLLSILAGDCQTPLVLSLGVAVVDGVPGSLFLHTVA